jgi:hypothetical protein
MVQALELVQRPASHPTNTLSRHGRAVTDEGAWYHGDGHDYRTLDQAISQMVLVVRPTHYGEKNGPPQLSIPCDGYVVSTLARELGRMQSTTVEWHFPYRFNVTS